MAEIRWWWQPPYTENLEEQAQKERFVQAKQITDALEANPDIANNLKNLITDNFYLPKMYYLVHH